MRIALQGGHVIVGTGETIDDGVVVIEEGRIVSVGASSAARTVDVTVALEGRTVMPGMIDAHIHMVGGDKTIGFDEDSTTMRTDLAATTRALLQGVAAARTTLRSGFTTVREVGGRDYLDVALRNAQRSGMVDAPRMLASGPGVWPTGGSGSHLEAGVGVDDATDALRRVRQLVAMGVDVIKFVSVDGPEFAAAGSTVYPRASEVEAVFAEATRLGRLKAAHAMCHDAIEIAARAGADTVEHGWWMTEENCHTLIANDTYLVGTVSNIWAIVHRGPEMGMPWASMMEEAEPAIMDRFRMAIELGVKVVVGTDVGGNPTHIYGESARELEAYVTCGMSPLAAIGAATLEVARAIRLDGSVGSLEPGKWADIVVIDGDPLADITLTRTGVIGVLQGGVIQRDDLGIFHSLQTRAHAG